MTVIELIEMLEGLRDKAELRSRMITENGQEVPEVHRAKSAAYADAYSFCIMQLRRINCQCGE